MTIQILVNYRDTDAQTRLADRLHDHHRYVVADCETTGLNPYKGDQIIGLAIYFPATDESFYVVVQHPDDNVQADYWQEVLRELPRCADVLIGYNFKFDLHFLGKAGMVDPAVIEDVMIAAHLLNENESLSNGGSAGAYQLKRLARKYLGSEAGAGEDFLKAEAKKRGLDPKREMWLLPADIVAPYAMADVEITWRLRQFYMPALESWQQVELYGQRNAFLLKALLRMERNGIKVNTDTIAQHQAEIQPQMDELQGRIDYHLAHMEIKLSGKKDERRINLNSPSQLKTYLGLLGFDVDSTDKFTLQGLASTSEIAKLILDYRALSKANSTYYNPYLELIDPDGFIHTNLNAIGTTSGRLSSSSPNFQQIPRGSEKFKVKQVFEPRPGYVSFGSDYKQLELRLGVHYSGEENMRRMFNEGLDLHQWTADKLGVTRHVGKTANFGLIYGMGAKHAVQVFGIRDLPEVERIVNGWRELYPAFGKALKTWEWQASQWRSKDGSPGGNYQFIRLFNGRVRHYQEFLKYPQYIEVERDDGSVETVKLPPPYRDAWNFYIQGTGAAIAEASILKACEALPDNDIFKPVLAVHDALEYEVALPYIKEVVPVVERIMIDWPGYNPVLGVDTEYSTTNWYEMNKYKPEIEVTL